MKRLLLKMFFKLKYFLMNAKKLLKKKVSLTYDDPKLCLHNYSQKPNNYAGGGYINKPIKSTIDLSIVIPVYNVEKFLKKCLDSILNQETRYFVQVICVDDGSPDESYKILEEYQEKFKTKQNFELVIIRQENRGFSGARNRGIDEASGKYLMFVDSDDYIKEGMIEDFLNEAYLKNLEIVIGGWHTFDSNTGDVKFVYRAPKQCEQGSPEGYHCYFWGKVYKREFFNDIRLPEGYWFEDMIVNFILHKKCKTFSYIPKDYYAYRQHARSISRTAPKRIKSVDQYWIVEYVEDMYKFHFGELDKNFYSKILIELGPFLYNRTRDLDLEVRKCVFACAANKIIEYKLDKKNFPRSKRKLIKAFENRDFMAWEILSRCYYE